LFNYEFKLYVALIFQVTCSIINILWFWSSAHWLDSFLNLFLCRCSCCSPSWKSPVLWISLYSAAKWMSNWSFGWISFSSCSIGQWWSGTSLCQLYLLIVWTNGYLVFLFLMLLNHMLDVLLIFEEIWFAQLIYVLLLKFFAVCKGCFHEVYC